MPLDSGIDKKEQKERQQEQEYQDNINAVQWLQKAAEEGDAHAQFCLGDLYHKGEYLSKDHTRAMYWLQKAAEQRVVLAQLMLGDIYLIGEILPQDYTEAAQWYQKAAEHGNHIAQFVLGKMYIFGQGVQQDYFEAANWLKKSSDQENSEAQFLLSTLYWIGNGVARDRQKACALVRSAAEHGNREAIRFYNKYCMSYVDGNGCNDEQSQGQSQEEQQPISSKSEDDEFQELLQKMRQHEEADRPAIRWGIGACIFLFGILITRGVELFLLVIGSVFIGSGAVGGITALYSHITGKKPFECSKQYMYIVTAVIALISTLFWLAQGY